MSNAFSASLSIDNKTREDRKAITDDARKRLSAIDSSTDMTKTLEKATEPAEALAEKDEASRVEGARELSILCDDQKEKVTYLRLVIAVRSSLAKVEGRKAPKEDFSEQYVLKYSWIYKTIRRFYNLGILPHLLSILLYYEVLFSSRWQSGIG